MEGMKPNPWAEGDKIEKEMDPLERARITLNRRIAWKERDLERRTEEARGPIRSEDFLETMVQAEQNVREGADRVAKELRFCHMLMERPDSTLRDHYKLDGAGRIVRHEKPKGDLPDLLDFLPYEKDATHPTAESVRKAALVFSLQYPEVNFEFAETVDMIEYIAAIRPLKSDDMVS